jgi:hypothetical protein
MSDTQQSGGRRTNEEEYFHKKDRELIEKLRKQARIREELRQLGEKVGVTDPAIIQELTELGFTPETVKLLPLIPVLETAWAEGGVSPEERQLLIDVARQRGVEPDSAADQQLVKWLDQQPDASVYRRAGRLIGALFESGGSFNVTRDDLIKYCETIAEASGGIFGIRKVSSSERAALARIAEEIKSRHKE